MPLHAYPCTCITHELHEETNLNLNVSTGQAAQLMCPVAEPKTYNNYIPYERESLANLENRPWFTKLKPSKLVLTINNLLADLLIHQTFFCQMFEKSQFAKLFLHQTFPLYTVANYIIT